MFSLPPDYVPGMAFVGFLSNYASRNLEINQEAMRRYLSGFDPDTLRQQEQNIIDEAERIRKLKVSPTVIEEKIASHASKIQGKKISQETAALRKQESEKTKLKRSVQKNTDNSFKKIESLMTEEKVAQAIQEEIERANLEKLKMPKKMGEIGVQDLKNTISTSSQNQKQAEESYEAVLDRAVASLVKKPPNPDKVMPEYGVTQKELKEAMKKRYGLYDAESDTFATVDDQSFENLKPKIEQRIQVIEVQKTTTGVSPDVDTSVDFALKQARELYKPLADEIEEYNKNLDKQIAELLEEKKKINKRQLQIEEGAVNPNVVLERAGIRNPALGTTRIFSSTPIDITRTDSDFEEPVIGTVTPVPEEMEMTTGQEDFDFLQSEVLPQRFEQEDPIMEEFRSFRRGDRRGRIDRSNLQDRRALRKVAQDETQSDFEFQPSRVERVEDDIVFQPSRVERVEDDIVFQPSRVERVEDDFDFLPSEPTLISDPVDADILSLQTPRTTVTRPAVRVFETEQLPRSLSMGGSVGFEELDEPNIFAEGALDRELLEKQNIVEAIQELFPDRRMTPATTAALMNLPLPELLKQLDITRARRRGISETVQKNMIGPFNTMTEAREQVRRDGLYNFDMYEDDGKIFLLPRGISVPTRFQMVTDQPLGVPENVEPIIEGPFSNINDAQNALQNLGLSGYSIDEQDGDFYLVPSNFEGIINPIARFNM